MTSDDAVSVRASDQTVASGATGGPDAGPSLNARTVVGVFSDAGVMDQALGELRAAGFSEDDVSVIRQGDAAAPPMSAGETKAGAGIATGATAGAVLGGIAGLAALAIPGIGPLIAAGPIVAALSGAATGGALGALAGSFAGLGMPSEHAQEYEAAVRGGGVFVSIKTADDNGANRAAQLLRQHGADKVSSYQPAL